MTVKSVQLPKGAQLNLLSIRCVAVGKSLLSPSLALLPYSPLRAKADFSSTCGTFLLISLAGGTLQNSLAYPVGPAEASRPCLSEAPLFHNTLLCLTFYQCLGAESCSLTASDFPLGQCVD